MSVEVGLTTFATLSEGTFIANPSFFCEEEKALPKAQHLPTKTTKGSRERIRHRQVVAQVHQRIANRQENSVQQESRRLIDRYRLSRS
ncbi:hypothetical protein KSC_070390 [Ktedonobacter sp. SOSP1-52]|uniref:transposase n=1 Tax=Ktedonobacter sp. SOSP1-52 TaxID=2778366 RepID=UPI0019162E43|nr:transposase [Ktedonobacter sp. SOSP1-52]GHO68147.1 hypothetical protein KSC_070390 [Ktedonobacter sp. SOSP1-52]